MGSQLKEALKDAGLDRARKRSRSTVGENSEGDGHSRDLKNIDIKVTFGQSQGRLKRNGGVAGKTTGARKVQLVADGLKAGAVQAPGGGARESRSATAIEVRSLPQSSLPAVSVAAVKLVRTGPFKPHPLLEATSVLPANRLMPGHDGISGDLLAPGESPTDEADLVIGLDFGTSCVKAVIGDHTAGRLFAVPFTDSIENPYLLPSRVFRSGDVFSLDGGSIAARDLKLGLLGSGVASPVREFNDACAFLALVVRHCRGWLLSERLKLYRRKKINWSLNLGLPARSYEDEGLVRLFRRLAWASANVAAQPAGEVTEAACDTMRSLSADAVDRGTARKREAQVFSLADVDVVPEVAAQIHGFVTGTKWDWRHRPMMMIVDVGAGTVDTAFFSYTKLVKGQPRLAVFANDVQPYGAINLHRKRVAWLLAAAAAGGSEMDEVLPYLSAMRVPTDRISGVPESVDDYIGGCRVELSSGATSVDDDFYRERIRPQVAACPQQARREKAIRDTQMQQVPCFLTGGGARMRLYRKVIEDVNSNGRNISLQTMTMSFPTQNFVCPGLRESDMDRLSVAYGLAHHGAGGKPLGAFMRTLDIPRIADEDGRPQWRDNYIDKDQC